MSCCDAECNRRACVRTPVHSPPLNPPQTPKDTPKNQASSGGNDASEEVELRSCLGSAGTREEMEDDEGVISDTELLEKSIFLTKSLPSVSTSLQPG
ncbi:hypothetical protein NQZ68_038374 [Dissostichus eleginoides]|nr:hypothetical protein NQZ68_038374 [Dissostichus eleginoides]